MEKVIDFNFILDKSMCAYFLIYRFFIYRENAEFFVNKLPQAKNTYNKFKNFKFDVSELSNDSFIKEIMQTSLFKVKFDVAKQNYINVLQEWKKYEPLANNYVTRTLKYTKPHEPVNVYITDHSGYSFKNFIAWGHRNSNIDGYNLAYLVHEWLHVIEREIFKDSPRLNLEQKMCHALIELCAEQTISHRFGFKTQYFISHPNLESYRKVLYPHFKKMLLDGDYTLEEFFVWAKENALHLAWAKENAFQ